MTLTPSQRGTANRRRGHDAERHLCRWLRDNGFAGAERAVRTGYRTTDRHSADPGDITGTGLIVWSVKDCTRERTDLWMNELDDMDIPPHYERLLVVKRRGHANPGEWWAWMWLGQLIDLYQTWLEQFDFIRQTYPLPPWAVDGRETPVRMELGRAVLLLRSTGHGDALDNQASLVTLLDPTRQEPA